VEDGGDAGEGVGAEGSVEELEGAVLQQSVHGAVFK
jgi:hypothetical protein